MECSKHDWEVFRTKILGWQEGYMDKLNKEYIKLLNGEGAASEKFWSLEKRLNQDRKHPGVMIQMQKSEVIYDIAITIE